MLAVDAIVGGLIGAWALRRIPEAVLRIVVVIGIFLTIGPFVRAS